MIYLEYEIESASRAVVRLQNFQPVGPSFIEGETSTFVEAIPELAAEPGKVGTLYINPQTKALWWEYKDEPLTVEQQLEAEKQRRVDLETQLAQTNNDFAEFMEHYFSNGGM